MLSVCVASAENLLGEVQSRDEANEKLSAELEGSKEDVNRMMEELKNKEQEHATETAELVNKNSELTEMLDDTMEKLDAAQEEVEEQASRLSETEVQTFVYHTGHRLHSYTGWAKKVSQRNLHITSSNTGRFSKFLHYNILQEICNKTVIKYPTSP